ncbi:MAG: hypothetical protein QNJ48_08260 [Desulfobacterales bacterium]|nr:hypothetical protein [Desulfobacterales bacterium]MDJ0874027.1 hypothetical protein [Desulfobacterales bacterium]MDJ0884141.1 hypothetical protein [Desulfobacterales bacterium]
MKDERNLHLKVQELCDCFATTDPLREMSQIPAAADEEEIGLKWLALAALHGVNSNASKITLSKADDGNIRVTAEYRTADLPSPGPNVGDKILAAIREITHIDTEKGKTRLALGMRDSSIDLEVKLKSKKGYEKVSIKFPH